MFKEEVNASSIDNREELTGDLNSKIHQSDFPCNKKKDPLQSVDRRRCCSLHLTCGGEGLRGNET